MALAKCYLSHSKWEYTKKSTVCGLVAIYLITSLVSITYFTITAVEFVFFGHIVEVWLITL